MKTAIVLLSVLLLIWIAGSSYVYVCKILKGCPVEETAAIDSAAIKQALADSLAVTTAEAVTETAATPEIPVPGLHILYFDFNKTECGITAESSSYFEQVRQYLFATTGKKVLVAGHSDAVGPDWAKEKVSEQRAVFVRQKLTEAGIPAEAVVTAFESDRKPVAGNSTEEDRAKNRRAEIIIQ